MESKETKTSKTSKTSWRRFALGFLLVLAVGSFALWTGRQASLVFAPLLVEAPRPAALLAFYAAGLLAQPLFWLDELPGWGRRAKRRDGRAVRWRSWAFVVPSFCLIASLGFSGIRAFSRGAQYYYSVEAAPGWDALSATGIWFVFAASLGVGFAAEAALRAFAKRAGFSGRSAADRRVAARRRAAVIPGANAAGLALAAGAAALLG